MKKICISFLGCIIIILSAICIFIPQQNANTQYLRIHIRANSNLEIDQSVKYLVKDKVVSYLTPLIAECDTKQKAQRTLEENLINIENVANSVLKSKGFNYVSSAKINTEAFPTRAYNNLTLEAGSYDALIINLGSGSGDNWWCVVYPPLCFTGEGTSYIYKSKIYEIINKFFNR